ncbi:hypothetical protein BaRGS_00020539, partial [Batillaria attramentaria]
TSGCSERKLGFPVVWCDCRRPGNPHPALGYCRMERGRYDWMVLCSELRCESTSGCSERRLGFPVVWCDCRRPGNPHSALVYYRMGTGRYDWMELCSALRCGGTSGCSERKLGFPVVWCDCRRPGNPHPAQAYCRMERGRCDWIVFCSELRCGGTSGCSERKLGYPVVWCDCRRPGNFHPALGYCRMGTGRYDWMELCSALRCG